MMMKQAEQQRRAGFTVRAVLLACVYGLLFGCAPQPYVEPPVVDRDAGDRDAGDGDSTQQQDETAPPDAGRAKEQPAPPIMPGQRAAPSDVAAVGELLAYARAQQDQGNLAAASAAAERALRIAPRDPRAYHRLAELQLLQHRFGQARQLALRGLDFAAAGSDIAAALRHIVAVSQDAVQ